MVLHLGLEIFGPHVQGGYDQRTEPKLDVYGTARILKIVKELHILPVR